MRHIAIAVRQGCNLVGTIRIHIGQRQRRAIALRHAGDTVAVAIVGISGGIGIGRASVGRIQVDRNTGQPVARIIGVGHLIQHLPRLQGGTNRRQIGTGIGIVDCFAVGIGDTGQQIGVVIPESSGVATSIGGRRDQTGAALYIYLVGFSGAGAAVGPDERIAYLLYRIERRPDASVSDV